MIENYRVFLSSSIARFNSMPGGCQPNDVLLLFAYRFLSEREAADRNYAIGFYMKENKCFPERVNLKETMDFYFQVKKS